MIEVKKLGNDLSPLFYRYQGQSDAQPAHVALDLSRETLSAHYDPEIGGAVPFSVYHGHERRYRIPSTASGAEINDLLEELLPLAERVLAGYESVWNGSNHVAHLSEDAARAEEEIERIIDGLIVEDKFVIFSWEEWYQDDIGELLENLGAVDNFEALDDLVSANLQNNNTIDGTTKVLEDWAEATLRESVEDGAIGVADLPDWVRSYWPTVDWVD